MSAAPTSPGPMDHPAQQSQPSVASSTTPSSFQPAPEAKPVPSTPVIPGSMTAHPEPSGATAPVPDRSGPAAPKTVSASSAPPTSPSNITAPPSSIAVPPPVPSTVIVLNAPPTPEHITPAPAVTPILAVIEVPRTPSAEVPPPPKGEVPPPISTAPVREPSTSTHRPVERVDTLVDLPSHTAPRSRRNSHEGTSTSIEGSKPKPSGLPIPVRPAYGRAASSGDLRSGLASPNIPSGAVEVLVASVHMEKTIHPSSQQHTDPLSLLTLRAGKGKKTFSVHRHLLVTKVPVFRNMLAHDTTPGPNRLTFEDLDEYGFALFVRWLYGGELHGPKDFHSFQHYLSLYTLALRFDIESLQNTTMDLCRTYYRLNSMTAPAYRIEYAYTYTSVPNHMRNFLTTTAAYRCLCEAPTAPGVYISDSLSSLLVKQGDFGFDFALSLIKLSKNGLVDVRRGSDCIFHVHSDGKVYETVGMEPYENF